MYTRCSHCKAVFRVTMKELTAAQGKLRCGECASVFNAMDSLSIKLPEKNDASTVPPFDALDKAPKQALKKQEMSQRARGIKVKNVSQTKKSSRSLLRFALVGLLSLVLAGQVWLTRDIWLGKTRQPEKIKMLSRKVFTHPNQSDALVITGTITNTADQSQPYPYVEAKLLDANNRIIALRRFMPHEYLENYEKSQLLGSQQQASIRLKIQDPPGHQAKQFKFSFL